MTANERIGIGSNWACSSIITSDWSKDSSLSSAENRNVSWSTSDIVHWGPFELQAEVLFAFIVKSVFKLLSCSIRSIFFLFNHYQMAVNNRKLSEMWQEFVTPIPHPSRDDGFVKPFGFHSIVNDTTSIGLVVEDVFDSHSWKRFTSTSFNLLTIQWLCNLTQWLMLRIQWAGPETWPN